jgi:hypothetical protein
MRRYHDYNYQRRPRRYCTIIVSFIVVVILYNFLFSNNDINQIVISEIDDKADAGVNMYSLIYQSKNGIYYYNVNEPIELWWKFECIKTKMRYTMNTNLCIHDTNFDKHVSGQIKVSGLWEPNNIRSFIKQMQEVPDAHFIDIGANIGLYSLIAAKYNRSVVAIEPLHENLIRLHKAAYLENVQSKITAVVNAVANERKQVSASKSL